jgi:hypothetical protein
MLRSLMRFSTLPLDEPTPRTVDSRTDAVLRPIRWDDHGHQVLFELLLRDSDSRLVPVGLSKILKRDAKRTTLHPDFERLDDSFRSMGQAPDFYSGLRAAKGESAAAVLSALRDLTVVPEDERHASIADSVVQGTLLRLASARFAFAEEQNRRPQNIRFRVSHHVKGFARRHDVNFEFSRAHPLERMVVLVGENGAGKSQYLNGLIFPVLGLSDPEDPAIDQTPPLSRLILLSFGAFDRFRMPRSVHDDDVVPYHYCGLRRYEDKMRGTEIVDVPHAMCELAIAHDALMAKGRETMWRIFISEFGLRPPPRRYLSSWVEERSAGQKFVCFVLTHLLAKLEPGALVLFDEPETHTHPKMLTTLMRQLGELLRTFDALAIVATHSPIVLQEVPARQVRVIRVVGEPGNRIPRIGEYPRECFAESLDEIVKTGFGLELTDTNYMLRLRELVRDKGAPAVQAEFARAGLSAHLAMAIAENLENAAGREDEYSEYREAAPHLAHMASVVEGEPECHHMRGCYAHPSMSDVKDRILACQAEVDAYIATYCQLCGGMYPADEWDHYLPQAQFPEFSSCAYNLIYSCHRCNGIKKGRLSDGDGFRTTVHLYYDSIQDDVPYLEASIRMDNDGPRAEFEPRLPEEGDPEFLEYARARGRQ